MTEIIGRRGNRDCGMDDSLLFFFLLLVVIFSNSFGGCGSGRC